ncbi:MAG: hypothetical protein R3246_16895, partial [Acidimicrobiia bacterium]|nr:hypothetical protein [Acidimicrobiia bacterium]
SGFRVQDEADADHFRPNGNDLCLTHHGGTLLRAKAIVRIEKDSSGGSVLQADWIGFGIASIGRLGGNDARWQINFNPNIFVFGDLDNARYHVKATPHHDCPGYDASGEDAEAGRLFTPVAQDGNTINIYCYTLYDVGNAITASATSFVVELWGPIGTEVAQDVAPTGWTSAPL